MSPFPAAPPPTDLSHLSHIRGIEDYWARATFRAPRVRDRIMADTILRDVLGIGIEQAATHLANARPDYPQFEAWVIATAGMPDPERVARYNAWHDGAPPPAATAARMAAIDAMPPVLDAAQMAGWDRDGYVVLRSAISREEAAAVEALLWRTVGATPDEPALWYRGERRARTAGIMVQFFQDPALEAARRSVRVHKAFAQLYGASDLWATTDRMSFNPPDTPEHPFQGPHLHWDTSLALPVPFSTGGILYLTDTAADQGALRVVPGFHRRLAAWLDEIGDADPRGIDLSAEAIGVAGGAGDLVIWRQELPHGASPNRTDRPRMAQYVNFYSPTFVAQPVWV